MNVLSIDLGAGSGRVVLCSFDGKKLRMSEQLRFPNSPVNTGENQYWDILGQLQNIKNGISLAFCNNRGISSMGIDAWGVDFGLFDKDKKLLENPYYYLDERTHGIKEEIYSLFGESNLNEISEGYIHPKGTLCQLMSMVKSRSCIIGCCENILMIPSIFEFFLTGEMSNEYTAATTTDIYSTFDNGWMDAIIKKIGLPGRLFKSVNQPGTVKGKITKGAAQEMGACDIKVISIASHDTASAVAAIPADGDEFLFISSGSCSILGLSTKKSLAELGKSNEFAIEGGMYGQRHFVKNLMGMYYFQRCKAEWEMNGENVSYQEMQERAAKSAPFKNYIDLEDEALLSPGSIIDKIVYFCSESGQSVPETIGETALCITQSIAMHYKYYMEQLYKISGRQLDTIYMVGGGINNKLLCQYTANATKKRVLAVCEEATVVGNALAQLMAMKEIEKERDKNEIILNSFDAYEYLPENTDLWDESYQIFLRTININNGLRGTKVQDGQNH